jgi:hypothetical protein
MNAPSQDLQREALTLAQSVTAAYADTPLMEVGTRLKELIEGVAAAVSASGSDASLVQALATVRGIRRALPETFGDRFRFDSLLIQAIVKEWSALGTRFSGFIVPRYGPGWGFYKIPMPSEDDKTAHTIRVLSFPGVDRLGDVDLSDYAWLLHELAHDAFYRSRYFVDSFEKRLTDRLRVLKLRSTADIGRAAARATDHIAALERYWSPQLNQHDWAHEVAVDVAALWALGAPLTMQFRRLIDREDVNVCVATDQHPPYVIRAQALAQAADNLGWSDEAWALKENIRIRTAESPNGLLVYGDAEILKAVVEESLRNCELLKIPRMTKERLEIVKHINEPKTDISFGSTMIQLGGLQRSTLTAGEYRSWMENLLRSAL